MQNGTFVVQGLAGEKRLSGEIKVAGAKNAALKVMASAILFEDGVTLSNVPEIEDVNRIGELLSSIGFSVSRPKKNIRVIKPSSTISSDLSGNLAKAMRSSIVLTGPLLARTGKVLFTNPGGCDFGNRPIDLFFEGFEKFGAKISEKNGIYEVVADNGLKGTEFLFRVQSHTGTETLMMMAILAKGKTILKNCALEPEVKSLATFLNSCGAKISGAGTSTITINGGDLLKSNLHVYKTIPDRIETSSFMILGALSAEKLVIKNCNPGNVEIVSAILRKAGVNLEIGKNSITVYGTSNLKAVNVRTHEYPGLPTDVQMPMAIFLTQADGESSLFETIYEGRLGYVPDLVAMGANIVLQDTHRALIKGKTSLVGGKIKAPDLRAGFGFILAGLIAKGTTEIENAYVIDRGYENIEKRLSDIGVSISRNGKRE